MRTIEILRDLIAFPTVSADSNRALIDYCVDLLKQIGAEITIIEDDSGLKANLYATIGPRDRPGVLLSGHTDVVPVSGQQWEFTPFEMSEYEGKLYGRGTTDMKGFIASALAMALKAGKKDLQTPLHLAFSYDEEIGCVGVRSMIEMLEKAPFRPIFCIVGEPTLMGIATGHKGKTACQVTAIGETAHSALAPNALNAIHLACDVIAIIRSLQEELQRVGTRDEDYDIAYTTLHVGQFTGGVALNLVPERAEFLFEIRNLPEDDPDKILERIKAASDACIAPYKERFPDASITIDVTNRYPPLSTARDHDVVSFIKGLTGRNTTFKVAFGTEGGLFSTKLGIPTVICGPGSMEQGHKADEFVHITQLEECDLMLNALLDRLEAGL